MRAGEDAEFRLSYPGSDASCRRTGGALLHRELALELNEPPHDGVGGAGPSGAKGVTGKTLIAVDPVNRPVWGKEPTRFCPPRLAVAQPWKA